ncbi:UPF0046 protein T07D4.2 [Trichinella papuae]|uniref:UPF0046 protein T07D4.2 n=1 Tax=Trichinella papuae TaxID=268474 RepID=A0A0V1MJL1_9BILA|nr:UPF0046 protein T07D4.2 [Trichinella papuae]
MLSASVMKMIKKSESIREKDNVKKQKLRNKYKRSYTEDIPSSSDDKSAHLRPSSLQSSIVKEETPPLERELPAEPELPRDSELPPSQHPKPQQSVSIEVLQKRLSHVTLLESQETRSSLIADPQAAWEWMKKSLVIKSVPLMNINTPKADGCCRIVCISDICGKHNQCQIPDGDILIVAGNFTTCGHPEEIKAFNNFLGTLSHEHKVVIAGENELTLDRDWLRHCANAGALKRRSRSVTTFRDDSLKQALSKALVNKQISTTQELLTNCIYLEDTGAVINGLRIYGTPWQPFLKHMAFNITDAKLLTEKWLLIPENVDILVTHLPPLGYCDLKRPGVHIGCAELLQIVLDHAQPKFHIFGQASYGYGCSTDGRINFVNACVQDTEGGSLRAAIVLDVKYHNHA